MTRNAEGRIPRSFARALLKTEGHGVYRPKAIGSFPQRAGVRDAVKEVTPHLTPTLAYRMNDLPSATSTPAEPTTTGVRGSRRRRVLVVDDGPSMLRITSLALRSLDYSVTIASSGEEGLQMARDAGDHPPELLITDLCMQGMGGKEFATKFQEIARGAKVIFISGLSQAQAKAAGIDSETDCLLAKPLTLERLQTAITAAFSA